MRGGVVQDQMIIMFYKKHCTHHLAPDHKHTCSKYVLYCAQTLLLMDSVSTAPYTKIAQHCSPSCLHHKVMCLRFVSFNSFQTHSTPSSLTSPMSFFPLSSPSPLHTHTHLLPVRWPPLVSAQCPPNVHTHQSTSFLVEANAECADAFV